jgi:hypothetical protein
MMSFDRGEHLVDRIVHRADQRRDRAAVERGQEGLADLRQDLPNDIVGLVLAVPDPLQELRRGDAVVGELMECIRRGHQRRGMGLEHAEEIAFPRQQPLEPAEHMTP